MVVYTSAEAAAAAEGAEAVQQGKENSVQKYIEAGKAAETGIATINNNREPITNNRCYSLSGQQVGNGYKGLVIKNGKKYYNKQ